MGNAQAGKDIDSYCGKCKLQLAHVIIAVKGSLPVRVECKTCHSVHGYRNKSSTSSRSRSRVGGTTAARKTRTEQNFDLAIQGRDLSQARRYKHTDCFETEQIVNHKLFGLGIVMKTLADRKIEVLFEQGLKVLVHHR